MVTVVPDAEITLILPITSPLAGTPPSGRVSCLLPKVESGIDYTARLFWPVLSRYGLRALYDALGFVGASSHSGRRTFITKAARKIVEAGGSLRDIQELAGHSSLATTQRYIAGDAEAKRRVVALV